MKLEHIQEEVDGELRWPYKDCYVELSTIRDAELISERLRPADRHELTATTHESPVRVLVDGVRNSSPCFTLRCNRGDICGIFGVRDTSDPNSGVVWMLGTERIHTISRTFLRQSREWLKELHKNYDLLYNVIDARNKLHIKWLTWMGFEFHKELPKYGVEQRPFILFSHHD